MEERLEKDHSKELFIVVSFDFGGCSAVSLLYLGKDAVKADAIYEDTSKEVKALPEEQGGFQLLVEMLSLPEDYDFPAGVPLFGDHIIPPGKWPTAVKILERQQSLIPGVSTVTLLCLL